MNINEIYLWLISNFKINKKLSHEKIIEIFGNDEAEHIFLILNYLIAKNLMNYSIIGTNKEYIISEKGLKLLTSLVTKEPEAYDLSEKKLNYLTESLVVNVPFSMINDLNILIKKYSSIKITLIKDSFRILLNNAKKEVRLAMPFFEFDGLIQFDTEFKNLARKKIKLFLLTRDVKLTNNKKSNLNKLRALAKLIDIYANSEYNVNNPLLEIKDFSFYIKDFSGTKAQLYEGIHQKMMIIDDKYAYIGSGEIRAASFILNGDVGIIQDDKYARFWKEYFDLFWKRAKLVPNEKIKSLVNEINSYSSDINFDF
ncbi:MAG: phospholipase D-like domain-containing protein [Candidatus Helarchaeota archaeon]